MFDLDELQVLRSSLNVIDIKGKNAQFIAGLQVKLEKEILKIKKEIEAGPPELQNKEKNKEPIKKQ